METVPADATAHGGEGDPLSRVLHSRHYNAALQRAVMEADKLDSRGILEGAVAEVAYEHLGAGPGWEDDERRRLGRVRELFRDTGLGLLELDGVSERGGEARVSSSHFATAWRRRAGGAPKAAVCSVPAGFLSGALAAVYGRAFLISEVECHALGAPSCRFRIAPAAAELSAPVPTYPVPPVPAPPAGDDPPVDVGEIAAVLHDALSTANGPGLLAGDDLTRLWTDFYAKLCFRFEREVPRVMGNKFATLPSLVLTEAAHVGAFHTLGELARSSVWRERVRPLLDTREDWVYGLLTAVGVLGWGAWRVHALVPEERLTVRVYDSYEALGYRRHFGRATAPKCYLARGTAAAVMNLLYVGDLRQEPELTPAYYSQLFRSPISFRALETRCRAADAAFCEFVVNPLSPSLSARFRQLAAARA